MKKLIVIIGVVSVAALTAQGQILLSSFANANYVQNFDTLAKPPATNAPWADNTTLKGWYAGHQIGKNAPEFTSYRVSDGSMKNGWLYSFGSIPRALLRTGRWEPSPPARPWRLRLACGSKTTHPVPSSNITVSYTGEQWRNGGKPDTHSLVFSYRVSSTAITNIDVGVDENWKPFEALDFKPPVTGSKVSTLDGHASNNHAAFSKVVLTGVTLKPGDELFLRWVAGPGNRHGLGVDDFSLSYTPLKKK